MVGRGMESGKGRKGGRKEGRRMCSLVIGILYHQNKAEQSGEL